MIPPSLIQVSIAGGSTIDRAGLALLLASFPGIAVTAIDANAAPTVIIWISGTDIPSPSVQKQKTFVLALTDATELAAFPPGVAGVFSKEETPHALAAAIRQVARGEQYLSPSLALSILRHAGPQKTIERKNLSEREREVLGLLAQGLSNKAIAARLYLSVRTVEGHIDKLYAHLGVHSRSEAILQAMQSAQDR